MKQEALDRLKRLVEAGEKAEQNIWECDEGITPFYNDANGYSCGGNGTGFCDVYPVNPDGSDIIDNDGELVQIPLYSIENAPFITQAANTRPDLKSLLEAYEAMREENKRQRNIINGFVKTTDLCVKSLKTKDSLYFDFTMFNWWAKEAKQTIGACEATERSENNDE